MYEQWLNRLDSPDAASRLGAHYGSEGLVAARRRYQSLITGLRALVPPMRPEQQESAAQIRFFTAPGRTELGGNHTDHNHGKVLAGSVQLDVAAAVLPREDKQVIFRSTGYPDVRIDLADLSPRTSERGTTEALVRGVAAELAAQGLAVGGFTANADSTVLPGSGLSSSAAVEVLFGAIFDQLYGEGTRSALELAKIGQKAENAYFGKPSGLMDQIACAYGGAVLIDFADEQEPNVKPVRIDLESSGLCLGVVNTRGSHADLTPEYAAIPEEMKAVARFFGKSVLRELDRETLVARAESVRKAAGDRAFLRALHFFNENHRVDGMHIALEQADAASGEARSAALKQYLRRVNESGDSSWELLQNLYTPHDPREQGLTLALTLTRAFFDFLKKTGKTPTPLWACRVHGGGFAGTIQVYIPREYQDSYRVALESVFGPGAFTPLRIRPLGVATWV